MARAAPRHPTWKVAHRPSFVLFWAGTAPKSDHPLRWCCGSTVLLCNASSAQRIPIFSLVGRPFIDVASGPVAFFLLHFLYAQSTLDALLIDFPSLETVITQKASLDWFRRRWLSATALFLFLCALHRTAPHRTATRTRSGTRGISASPCPAYDYSPPPAWCLASFFDSALGPCQRTASRIIIPIFQEQYQKRRTRFPHTAAHADAIDSGGSHPPLLSLHPRTTEPTPLGTTSYPRTTSPIPIYRSLHNELIRPSTGHSGHG